MNVLDVDLLKKASRSLELEPCIIEKDWHVVQALAIVSQMPSQGERIVFAGGTSLAKGWKIIQRFSEDCDFKVYVPPKFGRGKSGDLRRRVIAAMEANGYALLEPANRRSGNTQFSMKFSYPMQFELVQGLRPYIQLEMTVYRGVPFRPTTPQSVSSFVGDLRGEAPEVSAIECTNLIETAADKLSALAWRICRRQRDVGKGGDPRIIRHLHDLGTLVPRVKDDPDFNWLAFNAIFKDTRRAGPDLPDGQQRLMKCLSLLRDDPLWQVDYADFVENFALYQDGSPRFEDALARVADLTAQYRASLTVPYVSLTPITEAFAADSAAFQLGRLLNDAREGVRVIPGDFPLKDVNGATVGRVIWGPPGPVVMPTNPEEMVFELATAKVEDLLPVVERIKAEVAAKAAESAVLLEQGIDPAAPKA